MEVLRTESLKIKGIQYPAYVVKVHAVSEATGIWAVFPEQEYIETHWYNPDSGLVLKFNRDWIRGGEKDSDDDYELVSVTFPKGATLALKGTPISGEAQTAKATTLPPAPYKAPLVGTKIKYDDRIYRVTRTDGFLTTYRSVTGDKLSYLNAYALFGEYADNLHVASPRDDAVVYEIDTGNRKKLETFWPLNVGNKTSFRLEEGGTTATQADTWKITLKVLRAEVVSLKGKKYPSYVVEERGLADSGKSYVGLKWYHPAMGLIVKAERKWTKSFSVGGSYWRKSPHFAEGEVDNYTLVKVRFPEGAVAVASKQDTKKSPAVSAAETARLKQAAEKARAEAAQKARAQEIARLEREAEKDRQARAQEIARLKREAEAASRARKAETSKATATEMARLKQEAEAVRRVHEAEIADLKREAEDARKIQDTEFARLKLEAEETRKAREAREIEIASLRRQLEEVLKARTTAEAPKAKADDGLAGIDFGNYHALIIGIDNYKNLPKLTTAINDARGVAKILKEEYGFKVSLLIDPDRLDIIDAFDELQETLTEKDNLLIYYAGHGWLNEEVDRGYWMPVDAKPKRRGRWISNATITDTLKGLSAKHVMVVADSCYSGTLVRAADVGTRKRGGEYWKEMASKWARVAITSGGLEPVADKGGSGHSPFAKAFIDALRDNDSIIDGLQLFGKMRRPVMLAADQTPQYADVRQAGHEGGDFLFVRRK